ncbi:MAG: peroxide stress protein YaaA [Paracoccaceae bacterium]
MLVVVSPAKKLDTTPLEIATTEPIFSEDAAKLAKKAGTLSVKGLRDLMHISEDLAKLNKTRFASFGDQDRKAAIYSFAGDTYQGFEAATLNDDALRWAQDHMRILSGLYGVLRPLDAIEPYRLEMGSKLHIGRAKSLYAYWGDRIATALNEQAAATGDRVLVNCASQEYFGAVDLSALNLRVITPTFLEQHAKGPRVVSFYAKRARGAMARFIVENRITDVDALRDFDAGGYAYVPDMSETDKPVFLRDSA